MTLGWEAVLEEVEAGGVDPALGKAADLVAEGRCAETNFLRA